MTKRSMPGGLLLVAGLVLFTNTASAQSDTSTPGVDRRQARQGERIQQGVASGELNRREAKRLEKGQNRVDRIEDKAKADGNVTAKERARLQQAENRQSRRIAKQKHDAQKARP